MTSSEFAALLVFSTAMAFTPGPNTTLSAALAANGGLKRAMTFILAVPFGWGLLLLACAGGLGALIQAAPVLRGGIKVLGLAYMLWLAWKLATTARMAEADGGLRVGFWQGVMLQFVNIKAWMNALTISAGWITVAEPIAPRLAIVLPLMMAYGLASNFTYALIGSTLRSWLAVGRRLVWFNRALAAVLVATAGWMAVL
ncbi:MAG: LysE family transporter [Rubrivivax sp.]|jgi:threonine/homoserine/homoserine lactone efflux protein|nr:LysE family transporter [Rubrivivax sp.]